MNFLKMVITAAMFIATISAAGLRPGDAEGYLMLTRSDYFRNQLLKKLELSDRATLKKRIKSAKLRAALKNIQKIYVLNSRESGERAFTGQTTQQKMSNRLNRFRNFHH